MSGRYLDKDGKMQKAPNLDYAIRVMKGEPVSWFADEPKKKPKKPKYDYRNNGD